MPDESWPAATVILLRDAPDGVETLLLHRNRGTDFAGGMAVFPGGRVEDDDWRGVGEGDELGAARNAAARETHEEAGLVIDPAALVPFSHWQPPLAMPKRFLTWFFVADAPEAVVAVDGREIVDHDWTRPAVAIEQHTAGALDLMPPTWTTLWSLRDFARAEEAIEFARRRTPPQFMASVIRRPGGMVFLFDGDVAMDEVDHVDRAGPRRRLYVNDEKPWRWEGDGL